MKRSALLLAALLSCSVAADSDAPKRPRITGIAAVTLVSTDFGKSRYFYHVLLGFPECQDEMSRQEMMPMCFVVSDRQRISLESDTPIEGPPLSKFLLDVAFATSDANSLRSYLKAKGVKVSELRGYQWAWKDFTAIDPEGHLIRFVQFAMPESQKSDAHPHRMPIIHAGFVVRERTATDHFYKDILGFRPYWHGGMKDDKDDWVAMQVPDGTDWVEYMLNVSPNADKKELGVMNHIALGATDIQAAKAQLLKNGAKLTEDPQMGRDGKWQLNVYDPDFTRIEFMEFTPVQKPCCSDFAGPHPKP